jgi:hypothetical protein
VVFEYHRLLNSNSQKTLKTSNLKMNDMSKKCILCEDAANLAIKATADYYCKECAEEQFGDLDCLVSIQEIHSPVEDAINQFEEVKDVVKAQREQEQKVDDKEIEQILQSD